MGQVSNFILCFVLQLAATLGLIFLFGKVIALCNRKFYSGFGSKSKLVCRITGIIGTPIHESSHALFCLIFRHKIKEIKFYQISSTDGTLGYVNHTYNPKSLYQRIGNLFIGIAPIIVGSLILCLLSFLLLPDMFLEVCGEIMAVDFIADTVNSFACIGRAFLICFSYITKWQWWLFLLIGSFIALHMTLSRADIKGALSGLIFFIGLLLVIDIILAIISQSLITGFTRYILIFGSFMLFFLLIFLFIMLLLLAVQALISLIFKRRR
ncbi:MAG: metalloprotease family protein [Clostridia bacterium]|nr:metalloprotease family protein [Clostridia bacterium]